VSRDREGLLVEVLEPGGDAVVECGHATSRDGRQGQTCSLKFTVKSGLLDSANVSPAAITSSLFARMLPLLSMINPTVTGVSS
jgi:hypothetical protein